MMMKTGYTITKNKQGTRIRATGAYAQAIFDALTGNLPEPHESKDFNDFDAQDEREATERDEDEFGMGRG